MEISLSSFEKVNEISYKLSTRGIRNMSASHLKHKGVNNIKLKVQREALKNVRVKADYLAAASGLKVKGVVTIIEVDQNVCLMPKPMPYARRIFMMKVERASAGGAQYENFQNINVKGEVRVVRELESVLF